MDPLSVEPIAPPGYQMVQNIPQRQVRPMRSQALVGCGIALIVSSCINIIVSITTVLIHLSNVYESLLAIAFIFDICFLVMAMLTLYGGYNIVDREQAIVGGMILGIPTMILKGSQIIIGFMAAASSKYYAILFVFQTFMIMTNVSLALTISIIICKKTCACCNRGKPTLYNQEAKYPQEMQSFATNMV